MEEVKEPKDTEGEESRSEEESEEIVEKSFIERVQDLLDNLKSVKLPVDPNKKEEEEESGKGKNGRRRKKKNNNPTYEIDPELKAFQAIVDTIKKKTGEQREALEDALKECFEEFYTNSREHLLEENMEFLIKEDIDIPFGESGVANIKISEIYKSLNTNNPESIDSVDASLYLIIQHVCPEKDLDQVVEICQNFEQDDQGGGSNFLDFVGNIVGRVSEKLGNSDASKMETEDGKIDKNAIGTVVQDLIGDEQIQGSMTGMMKNITSADFDINSVFKGLFKMQKKSE